MYKIDSTINETEYNGLQVRKLWTSDTAETLMITMDEGVDFPEHTSPRNALLVVLEGTIEFKIQNRINTLTTWDVYKFPANEPHQVYARIPSKFLIIR